MGNMIIALLMAASLTQPWGIKVGIRIPNEVLIDFSVNIHCQAIKGQEHVRECNLNKFFGQKRV